jgi:hypothetical protein
MSMFYYNNLKQSIGQNGPNFGAYLWSEMSTLFIGNLRSLSKSMRFFIHYPSKYKSIMVSKNHIHKTTAYYFGE